MRFMGTGSEPEGTQNGELTILCIFLDLQSFGDVSNKIDM